MLSFYEIIKNNMLDNPLCTISLSYKQQNIALYLRMMHSPEWKFIFRTFNHKAALRQWESSEFMIRFKIFERNNKVKLHELFWLRISLCNLPTTAELWEQEKASLWHLNVTQNKTGLEAFEAKN